MVKYLASTNIRELQLTPQLHPDSDLSNVALLTLCDGASGRYIESKLWPYGPVDFTQSVSGTTQLVHATHRDQSTFYLLEINDGHVVLKTVAETVPTYRFESLLKQKLYAEAISLAVQCGLDQEVHCLPPVAFTSADCI
jgi:hypothetical protein